MTNLERLKIEIEGIDFLDEKFEIYLQENDLTPDDTYNPESNTNKKNIYKSALSILESLANNPMLMRNYKSETMTITDFADSLQNRIQMLDRKIRMLPTDEDTSASSNFVYIFDR